LLASITIANPNRVGCRPHLWAIALYPVDFTDAASPPAISPSTTAIVPPVLTGRCWCCRERSQEAGIRLVLPRGLTCLHLIAGLCPIGSISPGTL
jgi:hypothetical protein